MPPFSKVLLQVSHFIEVKSFLSALQYYHQRKNGYNLVYGLHINDYLEILCVLRLFKSMGKKWQNPSLLSKLIFEGLFPCSSPSISIHSLFQDSFRCSHQQCLYISYAQIFLAKNARRQPTGTTEKGANFRRHWDTSLNLGNEPRETKMETHFVNFYTTVLHHRCELHII